MTQKLPRRNVRSLRVFYVIIWGSHGMASNHMGRELSSKMDEQVRVNSCVLTSYRLYDI